MSDNRINIGGSLSLTVNNTPTRIGQRVPNYEDVYNISAPFIGMIVYVENEDSFVYIKSLKSSWWGTIEIKNSMVQDYAPLLSKEGEFNLKWNDVL